MKFYKTTFFLDAIDEDGRRKQGKPVWCSSEAASASVRAAKKKEFKDSNPTTTEVDIEPTKAGLLAFLNSDVH